MKKLIVFTIAVAFLSIACQAQKNKKKGDDAAQKVEIKNYTDSVSYSLGVLFGKSLKEQGFENLNTELIVSTFKGIIEGTVTDSNLRIPQENCSPIVNNYFINKQKMVAQKNLDEGEAFLQKNKTQPGVVSLPSGLQYKVIREGTGVKPGPTDNVTVHYTGTLIDGRKFDSSVDRGEPLSFNLNGVIKGWTEGLQLMSEGAKYMLYIPTSLGYGERGAQGSIIGPNAALVFEVELIKVNK